MKRRLSTLLLALLLAVFASASAEEILYTGTVSKPMTIRAKKSTSAAKLGSVETGELINIVEYGSEWTKVDQNGVVGYVLTRHVWRRPRAITTRRTRSIWAWPSGT